MTLCRAVAVIAALSLSCGPEEGPPGPEGPIGPQGPTGAGGGLSISLTCSADGNFSPTSVHMMYERALFEDGSIFVSCGVRPDNGPVPQKDSLPKFYRAGDPSSDTGPCEVLHDMSTESGRGPGRFVFTTIRGASGSNAGTVTYRDTGTFDGAQFPLLCVVNH